MNQTCKRECRVCEEHAESVDANGICQGCAPDARQCSDCLVWFDKTAMDFRPGDCGGNHHLCEECKRFAPRCSWTGEVICPACTEEAR